jgi:hypothetical protein
VTTAWTSRGYNRDYSITGSNAWGVSRGTRARTTREDARGLERVENLKCARARARDDKGTERDGDERERRRFDGEETTREGWVDGVRRGIGDEGDASEWED